MNGPREKEFVETQGKPLKKTSRCSFLEIYLQYEIVTKWKPRSSGLKETVYCFPYG